MTKMKMVETDLVSVVASLRAKRVPRKVVIALVEEVYNAPEFAPEGS